MSEIRRTDQGGSIVTFIIVGVILALGLVGGIYALNKHGEQVRKDQAIAAADKQKAANEAAKSESTNNSEVVTSGDDKAAESSNATVKNAQNLPTTGAELSISGLVGAFLLTVSATGYVSSRRNLIRSL